MKVSVVIPTYNRAALVVRAVRSVLDQEEPADEIIVVDDGSTDETLQALQEFTGKIRLITQPNTGVSAARNSGIAAARYPWVAFLDSDDVWHPQKLALQKAFHRKHPSLRWSHTNEAWTRNGKPVPQRAHHAKVEGEAFYEMLDFCKIAPSTVILHEAVLKEIGVFDEKLPVCEDFDLWLRILRRYPVGLVETVLTTKYAGHPQLSLSSHILDRYRVEALLKHLPDRRVEAEIVKKIIILEKGAKKHRNEAISAFCARIRGRLRLPE